MLLRVSIVVLFLSSALSVDAQFRNQYIKWGVTGKFNKLFIDEHVKTSGFDVPSASLIGNIAIFRNDIDDAAHLYGEIDLEVTPVAIDYSDRVKFYRYSANGNLKKFLSTGNYKDRMYVIGGPRVEYWVFHWKNSLYKKIVHNVGLNMGLGYTLTDRLELRATGSRSWGLNTADQKKHASNTASLALIFFFQENWWFR